MANIITKSRGQRKPYEQFTVTAGQALSGTLSFSGKDLGLQAGYLWRKIRLALHLTTTHASESYPFELAGYYFLKMLDLTMDGRQLVHCPGAALYWLNALVRGNAPYHKNVLAAAATYDYIVDIPFVYPKILNRAEDCMVDDTAYSNATLQLQAGSIADIFATVSTATVSATVDVVIERAPIASFVNAKPVAEPMIRAYQQVATSSTPYWDLESNQNLMMFMLYILNGGSATAPFFQNGGSNGAWGGVDGWDKVILDDSIRGYTLNNVPVYSFMETRNNMIPYLNAFGGGSNVMSPTLVGLHPVVFPKDKSTYSGYPTAGPNGAKSRLRLSSGNVTASDYADLLVLGGRKIDYRNGVQVRY